jgi:hypothetical protein
MWLCLRLTSRQTAVAFAAQEDAAEAATNDQFFRGWSRKPTCGKSNGASSLCSAKLGLSLVFPESERRFADC